MSPEDDAKDPDTPVPRILTYEDFKPLSESFADEVVNLVCLEKNPNIDKVFGASCTRERLRPILAAIVTPGTSLAQEIIPNSDKLCPILSGETIVFPLARPVLEIIVDQFRRWIYTSAAQKIEAKADSAAGRIRSKIWNHASRIAKEIIADSDFTSYNPANTDYDRYIPADFEQQSEDDLFLVQNFNNQDIKFELKARSLKELLAREINRELPLAIIDGIKTEVADCISAILIADYKDNQQNLPALAPATLDSCMVGKSPAVRAIISSFRRKILEDLLRENALKSTFFKIIDLFIAEGYDNEEIAHRLIAKFGKHTSGYFLNNFSLWIVDYSRKKGGQAIYFDRMRDHLDELIMDNSGSFQAMLGTMPPDTTWRQFFADVDHEFALLKTSDDQWAQAATTTAINNYLLPAFIGLAKKGYNVRYLTG